MFSSIPFHASHLMSSLRYLLILHSCICKLSLPFFHWHQITCHEYVITLIFFCKFLLCGFNQNGIIILTCFPIIFNHLNSPLPLALHLGVRIMWIIIPCFSKFTVGLPATHYQCWSNSVYHTSIEHFLDSARFLHISGSILPTFEHSHQA